MKKNKTLRFAAILLVVTMLSTCVVSGTFAKYVTEAEGSASARVAKWGVQLSITGDNFAMEYANTDEAVTVKATEYVVAPGTSSEDLDADIAFAITGTPEVTTQIKVEMGDEVKDIYLPAGEYTDYTKVIGYNDDGTQKYGTFKVGENGYYPVKWTLKQDGVAIEGCKNVKLADIKTFLDTYNTTSTYAPGTVLDASFTLEWAWDFDANGAGTNDAADTLLGNIIAEIATVEGAVTTVSYSLKVTATQVD